MSRAVKRLLSALALVVAICTPALAAKPTLTATGFGNESWIASGREVVRVDESGVVVESFRLPFDVEAIAPDAAGSIWLAGESSLAVKAAGLPTLTSFALSSGAGEVKALLIDALSNEVVAVFAGQVLRFSVDDPVGAMRATSVEATIHSATLDVATGRLYVVDAVGSAIIDRDGTVERSMVVTSAPQAMPFVRPHVDYLGAGDATFRFGFTAECLGVPCTATERYLSGLSVSALLEARDIGADFRIDPLSGVASVAIPVAKDASTKVLRVEATDAFGTPSEALVAKLGGPDGGGIQLLVAPTVSITSPANNAVFQAPANISLSATAADSDGTVSKVDFFRGGTTLIGTDNSPPTPFTFAWNGVAAGTYSLTAKATDNSTASTTSAAISIIVNAQPTVSITLPANNATFTPPASISLRATAADSDGTISKVEFFRGGTTLIGTDSTPPTPFTFNWNSVATGAYTLTAKATDNRSGVTTSTPINITVNTLPTASITSPANNAVFTAPANITITATATDSDGTISKVEFFNGAALIGTDNTLPSPFTFSWTNVAAGTYTLTAKSTDNLGGTKTSSVITVIVNAPPIVTLTAPANGATIHTGAIALSATASDPGGSINRVEFYNGATFVGQDTSSPYTFNWTQNTPGTYSITAKAVDNLTVSTTSSPAVITVVNNFPPTVTLTAPANGATVTAGSPVTLAATASDSGGSISEVQFYDGTTQLGGDFTSPYAFAWTPTVAGSHTLTAVAYDNQFLSTTSAPVTITVIAETAPTIAITKPLPNEVVWLPDTYRVEGTYSGPAGSTIHRSGGSEQATLTSGTWFMDVDTGYMSPTTGATINTPGGNSASASVPVTTKLTDLKFLSPGNGVEVYASPVVVTARFDGPSEATMTINGVAATRSGNVFSASVPVSNGNNFIVATAAWSTYTKEATVVVTKGDPQPRSVAFTYPSNGAVNGPAPSGVLNINGNFAGNNRTAVILSDGRNHQQFATLSPPFFSATVPVVPGLNTITATATGPGGDTVVATVTFTIGEEGAAAMVVVTSPGACTTFTDQLAPITITADAVVPNTFITGVNFYANNVPIGTDSTAPYSISWTPPAGGSYQLRATATYGSGSQTPSSTIVPIHVGAGAAPTCVITAPTDGATFSSGSPITINATATDSDGTITKVEFFQGATLLGQATAAPYSYTWPSVAQGNYVLTAKATDNSGTSTVSAPVNISVTTNSATPTITINSPQDGYTVGAGQSIGIDVTAQVTLGTLAKFELFDAATLVSTVTLNSGTSFNWTFFLNNPSVGDHAYTVKVTNTLGPSATAGPLTIHVTPAPTVAIVWPVTGAFFTAPASLDITATAAQENGTINSVEFVANGSTFIGNVQAPPYTVRWTGVAAGTYTITARAASNVGQTTSEPVTITVGAAPSVTPTTPSGSSVNDNQALITGAVQAPPNSAVTVNGIPAIVTADGQFFANDVYLAPGPNEVTVRVTGQDGQTTTQSITVNGAAASGFRLDADPKDGVAPLAVKLTPTNTGGTAFASVEFDFDGNGSVDYTLTSLDGGPSFDITYSTPGIYRAKMIVKDAQQQVLYSTEKVIYVLTFEQREHTIRGVYQGLVERLQAGNITGALKGITAAQRPIYQEIFTSLGTNLQSISTQLGTVKTTGFSRNLAELIVSRETAQGTKMFSVLMIRGEDGIWRIDGM